MKACFLDTCAAIDVLRDKVAALETLSDFDEALMSHVVYGELLVGCYRSRNPQRELSILRAWLPNTGIITATPRTSDIYGQLEAALRAPGTPIPQNDVWIAALCIECELPLVSNDLHFDRIPTVQRLSY